jgi:hypothetical protein
MFSTKALPNRSTQLGPPSIGGIEPPPRDESFPLQRAGNSCNFSRHPKQASNCKRPVSPVCSNQAEENWPSARIS